MNFFGRHFEPAGTNAMSDLLGEKCTNNQTESTETKSYLEDDDSDSLASALSDYNSTFYDVPTITFEQENVLNKSISRKTTDSNFVEGSSTDISLEENRPDEFVDLNSIEDDIESEAELVPKVSSLDENEKQIRDFKKQNQSHIIGDETTLSNLDDDAAEYDDEEVEREFEQYLNDDSNSKAKKRDEDELVESSLEEQEKLEKLKKLELLDFSFENYENFQKLAIERHGLLNKRLRRRIWPLLILYRNRFKNFLDSKSNEEEGEKNQSIEQIIESSLAKFEDISDAEIKSNSYFNQVTLDVVRTLKRFPPEISDRLRTKLQKQLIDLICKILIRYDHLHYYQGYHDICLTFLLVTGADKSIPLLEHISLSHFTCFMETTMESTLKLLFNIMPLIDKMDTRVSEHIQKAELGVIFGLSWLITWYSHVMDNLVVILRLYDFFIATHPLMPVYLGAIIIVNKADVILSTECDMASLHTIITKFPSNINCLNQVEDYIQQTLELFASCPPDDLPKLNENWLVKCKRIQEEKAIIDRLDKEYRVRQRLNKRKNKNLTGGREDFDIDLTPRRGRYAHNLSLTQQQHFKNRFLVGLTVTVGVAAVAMYAINTKDPQDIFSKFYHLLSYKNF